MAHFEIEIKSLIGTAEQAAEIQAAMHAIDPTCALVATNTQLNHYFKEGDIAALVIATAHFFTPDQRTKFERLVQQGADFSVRTRQRNDEVLLVVKAAVDAGTSANAVSRLEFEEVVSCTLSELDALVLSAGFNYQAKWSRERSEYVYKGINVCFDKNAGYGYLAEFEKVITDEQDLPATRALLDTLMAELGVVELSQDRLGRMFDYYNANWAEYYGTDKTFTIE